MVDLTEHCQAGQALLSDQVGSPAAPLAEQGPGGKVVEVPAYAAMHNPPPMGRGCWISCCTGASTRNYKQLIPKMSAMAGVSRSPVSRAAVEASEAEVEALLARRFDELKLLVIYIDEVIFGDYTMIGAAGVDAEGHKHMLGIQEGATENSAVVTELLEDIVSRGVDPKRKMLFVIVGSKTLRAAINAALRQSSVGATLPRPQTAPCRVPADRSSSVGWSVLDYLPKWYKPQVKSLLQAAWKRVPTEA